jgi:hypothetical protein
VSLLSSVTTGRQIGPQIHVIAGVNGVGKTTWAASFPKPLVIDLEKGSSHIDVARITPDNIPGILAFRDLLKDLRETRHDYQTLVIDSAEALEGLICDGVCKEGGVASIELYEGGYGKGFTRTREIMREIMIDLQKLQAKGMTSIIVAHTQVKNITDPTTNQAYDRVIMRCNDKMAALIRDLSDNVFYASYKVFTTKEKGKTKAFGDGQRVMYTQWRPGFDAKNRLDLPLELPLSYDAFAETCKLHPEANVEDIVSDIQAMAEKMDETLRKDVHAMLEKFKGNPTKLKEVKNRLMKYVAA